MSNLTDCSKLDIPAIVGPAQVFASLGHWNTAVYVVLALHFVPVWLVAILALVKLPSRCPQPLQKPSACLICVPPALMALTSIGILLPSTGKYIEVLLEIVLSFGLVKFCEFCRITCGGDQAIVAFCREHKILLPIGSPPMVCLLPCRRPSITRARFALVSFMPHVLLGYKIILLVVDLTFLAVGHQPSGGFFDLDNLHNVLSFPVGLLAIYSYTMFNFLMNDCLEGNSKRFLGIVLLLEFILFDCLRLFFIFLTGTGMLTCVPPFLSQTLVAHTLKNYIKAFLATFVGIPYLTLCAGNTELQQVAVRTPSVASLMAAAPDTGDANNHGVALAGSLQGDNESPRKRSVEGNTRRNVNDGSPGMGRSS